MTSCSPARSGEGGSDHPSVMRTVWIITLIMMKLTLITAMLSKSVGGLVYQGF